MPPRQLLLRRLLGTLLVLALAFLALALLSLFSPGVSLSNFERIKVGMSVIEVEGLLGGPGELGRSPETGWNWDDGGPDNSTRIWRRERHTITVTLDSAQRVLTKEQNGLQPDYLYFLRGLLPW
jgi:hypothetical protein